MAWPLAFFTFVALTLFLAGHSAGATLSALATIAAFIYSVQKFGRRFIPVIVVGALLGTWLFFLRADFFCEQQIPTAGVARVSSVSRRSVILTLDNSSRLRLTGFRTEKLPLRGARVSYSCRPYSIPEGDFAVFERLSGVRIWCEKITLETIEDPQLAALRSRALSFLHQRFAALGEESLIAAFVLGDTETMSARNLVAFRDMGLMHLFAVSGLNVALLFALLYVPFRFAGIPTVGAVLGFLIATAFLLLLDFPVPLFRAWLFLAIGALARLLDRRLTPWTLLFLTALIVEALFPLSTFTISFILSFGITAAILLFYEPMYFCFSGEGKIRELIAGHLALTLSAGLPAFVLGYLLFGSAQPLALVYNLLLVPFSGLYLFASVIYIAFDFPGYLLRELDALYLWFAKEHWLYAMRYLPVPDSRTLLLPLFSIAILLLALLYWQARKRLWTARRNLKWGVSALLALIALPWLITPQAKTAFYAVPDKLWNFDSGRLTSAGKELFATISPDLCLPVNAQVSAEVKGGVIKLESNCFAFAASLKPELWRTDEFAGCRSLQLFQSKKLTTGAKEWEQFFRTFALRGPVELRNYFTWYADRPISCARVRRLSDSERQ